MTAIVMMMTMIVKNENKRKVLSREPTDLLLWQITYR